MKHTDSIDEQMGAVHAFLDLPAHSYKDENGNIRTSNVNDEGEWPALLLTAYCLRVNCAFMASPCVDWCHYLQAWTHNWKLAH